MLLDDVLSALDAGSARMICDNLFGRKLVGHRVVVLVSHHSQAFQYAHAVLRLADGTISAVDPKEVHSQDSLKEAVIVDDNAKESNDHAGKEDQLYAAEVKDKGRLSLKVYAKAMQAGGGYTFCDFVPQGSKLKLTSHSVYCVGSIIDCTSMQYLDDRAYPLRYQ